MKNSGIDLYIDTILIESFIKDPLIKIAQAGPISSLVEYVKRYASDHLKKDDIVGSVIDMLAPGAISTLIGLIPGMGLVGTLVGILVSAFHIDISGFISSAFAPIKSVLMGGGKVSSNDIAAATSAAIEKHIPEEVKDADPYESKTSLNQEYRKIQFLKFAILNYKVAGVSNIIAKTGLPFIGKILSWIFKVVLASAGCMAVGDAANYLVDAPNAFEGTIRSSEKAKEQAAAQTSSSRQTKFSKNPSYSNTTYDSGWTEKVKNDSSSIENMLINFAKQVYSGLDGYESEIKSTVGFQVLKNKIESYNQSSPGDFVVFIPKYLTSKKQIVDMFIDDVAAKVK